MSDTVARHDSDKRVIRTKKAIKAALFKIMEEKDISSITISELTEKANINRRTFYTHYRSITDILDEIEGDLVQALTELMRNFDVKEYRTSAYNLFMGLNDLISGEFDYYFQLVRVDMRGMLISRLKHVIKETTDKLLAQICRRTDDISMISSFIVGGFFNSYLEWHNHPERLTAEQAAELASSMVAFCVERISRKD
ncbi:MAG: TetR/AcrR family transcriptional regulator [Oscillospiraceae bacterium]